MLKKAIRNIFLLPIYIYQYCLSPILGSGKCRYSPSCSAYFVTAVKRFGVFKGSIMGFARLLRCRNSFLGGPDEVPEKWSWKEIKKAYVIYRKPKKN